MRALYVRVWVYSSMVERWPFKPRVLGSTPSAPNVNVSEKVAEWFKAADCKSVRLSYRRFESCSSQFLTAPFI